MNDLINRIKDYYKVRELKWPSFDGAMKFVHTELAEVYELDLAREGGWVRNHPEKKPKFSKELLAEELGDAIFMLMVAGIVEGVDPINALLSKMTRKLQKFGATAEEETKLVAQFYSDLEVINDEPKGTD